MVMDCLRDYVSLLLDLRVTRRYTLERLAGESGPQVQRSI
jgi:hypothetical protein